MKRSTRNLLAMALATQMVFSLTACGAKEEEKSDASKYPEKEVEVVYHSSVGSGGDIMLRPQDLSYNEAHVFFP